MSLFSSIGEEGRSTLWSTFISIDSERISYERVIRLLEKHYKCEESLYVRTQKFVNVKQAQRKNLEMFLKE